MLKQLGNRTGEVKAAFVAVASRPRSSRYWCQRNGAVPRARIARNYAESVGALVPMVPGTRRSALIARPALARSTSSRFASDARG
jgi:hypothetical protein